MTPEIESLTDQLRCTLSKDRFLHTMGVRDSAVQLATRWNADASQCELAAILHDCARGMSWSRLLAKADELGVPLSQFERLNPVLAHAPVGAAVAKAVYGVTDTAVLTAIRYHTTGHASLDMVGQVVYLADFISAERTFPGVEEIRRLAQDDFIGSLLAATKSSLLYLLDRRVGIHPDTVGFWNALIRKHTS